MPDISMCINYECNKRKSCYRYRARPSRIQLYGHFSGQDGCVHYWELTDDRSNNSLTSMSEADETAKQKIERIKSHEAANANKVSSKEYGEN